MDLGIAYHECNQCGAMIYPNTSVNSTGARAYQKTLRFMPSGNAMTDEQMLPMKLYNDIQSGKHDDDPELSLLKNKTYIDAVVMRRNSYSIKRTANMEKNRTEAKSEITELKKKAALVTSRETEDGITIEAERHESLVEGSKKKGTSKCPVCGLVLMSWSNVK